MAAKPGAGVAGGILGRDLIGFLGSAATYGLDVHCMVRATPSELALYVDVATAAVKHQGERDQALARAIIGELARALKRH